MILMVKNRFSEWFMLFEFFLFLRIDRSSIAIKNNITISCNVSIIIRVES